MSRVDVIWGFKTPDKTWGTLWHVGPFVDHEFRERKPGNGHPTWDSVHLLQSMGLLSFVPHIFENDTDVAEPIHPFGIGETAEAPIEREIGDVADHAARAMALPSKLGEAIEDGFLYFCPILKTKPTAQMIGVARLTYRPHTKRTAAWFAELNQTAQGWIDTFRGLSERAEAATSRRSQKYA